MEVSCYTQLADGTHSPCMNKSGVSNSLSANGLDKDRKDVAKHATSLIEIPKREGDIWSKTKKSKLKLGNDLEEVIKSMGNTNLVLGLGFELILKDTFYVPSFRRNLISIYCLYKLAFSFTFGKRKINLILNSQIRGYGSLVGSLYKLSLVFDDTLEMKYLIVRDLVKDGSIMVEHINTNSMVVHPLTKGLKHIVFKRHVEYMSIVSYYDVLLQDIQWEVPRVNK
ncbi:hypothetical protein CR513_38953, partial [Mucuna pruriens]